MKSLKYLIGLTVILPATAFAWQWIDLWQTADQQGASLLKSGRPQAAAQVFADQNWQAVADYRAGDYAQALMKFNGNKTSDGLYNAGNAAAFMGKYQEAIAAYDKALALNANNKDAAINREIIKKLLQQQKPEQQDQKQQSQQQQQNQQKSAAGNNNQDDKSNSAAQQKKTSQSSEQQDQADQEKQQQEEQKKNSSTNLKQQSAQNKKQDQSGNMPKESDSQQQNDNAQAAASNKQQSQDENNDQLLRRLADDPGGLLRQKFLRDYERRHGGDQNSDGE